MLVAVNSKRGKYEPRKYMINGKRLAEQERERERREPMTGDEVLARFRQIGMPIIDLRASSQQSAVSNQLNRSES
jgi:hypothetical protein